jgi:hypothetical protein
MTNPEIPGRPDPRLISGDAPISKGRKILAAFITLILVPLIGFLFLELIFAFFVPVTDVVWTFWDPVTGVRRHPDQKGRYIKGEIDASFSFNAQGWNHPNDYEIRKPKGTLRVALVGDSMVEAKQVAPENSMAYLAQQEMSRPDRPVEWYSFGMAGWGLNHEFQALKHYAMDYSPDLVILMFVQNDPADTSPYLTRIERYEPKYSLDENDELVYEAARYKPPHWKGKLAFKSNLLRYFFAQKGVWARLRGATRQGLGNVSTKEGSLEVGDNGDRREREAKTWKLLYKLIEAMRDEARKGGAEFALVFRGNYKVLDAAAAGATHVPLPGEDDPYCLGRRLDEMGYDLLRPMAVRLGIPYLDLTSPLEEMIRDTGTSHRFPEDNHYNAAAHRVVAGVFAGWADSLLSEQAPPE